MRRVRAALSVLLTAISVASLSAQVVTESGDAGPGTLRAAVADAAPGATITFAADTPGQGSYLSQKLTIGKDLTIDGVGVSPRVGIRTTFQGQGVIEISAGANVTIRNLDVTLSVTNYGSLHVSSATMGGDFRLVVMNQAGAMLTLDGVTVYAAPGVVNAGGTVFINNSEFQGDECVLNRAGEVTATSTRFKADRGFAIRLEGGRFTGDGLTLEPMFGTGSGMLILNGATAQLAASEIMNHEFVGIRNEGLLVLHGSLIRRNRAGGLRNLGAATVTDCEIVGNYSETPGGGIINDGNLTLVRGGVRENENFGNGAGILNGEGGTLSITETAISNNEGRYGAGLYNYGNITAARAVFSGNHGVDPGAFSDGAGAAIYSQKGVIELSDCQIINNTTPSNGGIVMVAGDLTLTRCIVTNNIARVPTGGDCTGGTGAAIASGGGRIRIIDSTVSHNQAPGLNCRSPDGNSSYYDGGPGGISANGDLEIIRSTIAHNIGTGIGHAGGVLTIIQSTIFGNKETGAIDWETYKTLGGLGGGILACGILRITNSTIAGNIAEAQYVVEPTATGGGIYFQGTEFSLQNSIVSGNVAGVSPNIFGAYTGSHNVVGGDAMIGPLQNNGGMTLTMLPAANSPAIDAGTFVAFDTDQRSLPRVIGLGQDIGAVEREGAQSLTVTGGPTPSGTIELRLPPLLDCACA